MRLPVCYIFGAGEYYYLPKIIPDTGDFVIAADGGYLFLKENDIPVNLVVGDFDSMPSPQSNEVEILVLPKEKDNTDMSAAIDEGMRRGYRVFHIYGGTGGRIDHTLANIQCITDISQKGGRGFLFDKDVIITSINNDSIAFSERAEGTISIFSHSETSTGIYLKGLKYPLSNATLYNTNPLGVSNEFIGVTATVKVECGTLIVIYPINTQEIEI